MKITYSSSLTDREWEIIEPLLPKKKNKTSNLDKKRNIRWYFLST
ncbi:hypothetical protein CWATWH0005_2412 [Crocosphaera watsonii WH 0005]|uniref:Uncharacterized protein n=1 Tax=Crocosphaera watsonii WH 0005 TaxID=423472 RepID=T2IYA6_CROWT|nr:hypothetical protein CWATWH0005_2412 [Crocosphaera watsonii WH 0005]